MILRIRVYLFRPFENLQNSGSMSNALGVDQIFDFARFSLNMKHMESVNYPSYSQKLFKIVVLVIMSICADSLVFLKFL